MHEWSHLVNARHIDWVIESIKQDPEVWRESEREVNSDALDKSCKSWKVAQALIRQDPDRDRAWDAAWDAVRYETQWAASDAALSAITALIAWGAILALMAWDDLDHYLKLHYEQLKFVAVLSEQPQAVLLLPMVYVKERIHA